MTIVFISTEDKATTHYIEIEAETPKEAKAVTDYYWEEVAKGNIYAFSVI